MCIICNLIDPNDLHVADAFLNTFRRAGDEMARAETALLVVATKVGAGDGARYRSLHKKLVRVRKEWNRLEQIRENGEATHVSPPSVEGG